MGLLQFQWLKNMCILRFQHTIHNGVELITKLPECHVGIEVSEVGDVLHRMFRILLVAKNLLAVLDELLLRNFLSNGIVLIIDR